MATVQGSQSHLRSLYRSFLRELPSRPLSSHSPLHTRLRTFFASPPPAATSSLQQVQEAGQFVKYVKSQRMYATLLERYNPGMNMDEEERVRLTARRVGMDLPVEYNVKPFGNGSGER